MRNKRKFQHIAFKIVITGYLTLIGLGLIRILILLIEDPTQFDYGLY